ncbi:MULTISPECIES: ABC transporter permease [Paenibacillus]|uniref:ABC transporter permease n=1 Tax=Paenibacillus TaxID=44249 RepID=UPI001F16EB82|nr:ABC transporter permease [Paenibacillus sp. JJ-223]CAH1203770.1 hypothetical protein PAECIP111890_02334 [Paenibacillus sp. JJ-223]
MGNFGNLVMNENMKIYRRARTWIMLSILAVLALFMPVLFKEGIGAENMSALEAALTTVQLLFFLNTIFSVVIAAETVAGEFTWGTIKLLLIRPWSRSKILASKYVSVIAFSVLSTLILILLTLGMSFILFGGGGNVTAGDAWAMWGYQYVDLFITLAIAFMVSSVFRSGALAIGLSLFIMFTQGIFSLIFSPERYGWAKYILFNNMDLSRYMTDSSELSLFGGGSSGMTLGFSVTVLAVYYIVFMVISWVVFTRRDVAGT